MMSVPNNFDKSTNHLDNLQIAAPCDVSWQSMIGDERVRLCSQCNKNVYNISNMSKEEANEFLHLTNHNACVNFFQRNDGTIVTDNCPRALKKLRDRYHKVAASISSLLALTYGFFLSAIAAEPTKNLNNGNNSYSSKQSTTPLGREPVAIPLGGAPIPMASTAEPPGIVNYRQYIKNSLIEAMPKNVNLGNAAISLSTDSQGRISELHLIHSSPEATTDRLILSTVKQLKFKPLPIDNDRNGFSVLRTYFECRCAQ